MGRSPDGSKPNHKIRLAWFIEPGSGLVHYHGATSGSSANVVLDPRRQTGVVVLMNQAGAPAVRLSHEIMKLLNGTDDLGELLESLPVSGDESEREDRRFRG